ncbi:MAG TPA: serine/threonine-protein kinase [Pirellulaceae bacterium]|nr:serine/threonine-protein kinase [Pirellulaceae bacterium]
MRTIGHFTLLEQLGSGGFGTVWKAKDTRLDRLVAVKIPHRDQVDPAKAELFLREARATAQLRHANIVAVHEVGRNDDTLYIVSDFIQGVTLADRLTAGPFALREAAELLARIAEALHHAHEAGVIHRDLKPQNIMLDADGRPHIMDFGLAKREAGEITMTVDGKILGTPAWMSPEQAQGLGHSVDPRTDVYSLGVILFQLLTHELPFRGNRAMLIHQVINEEPPSPRKLNSRVPRDLETITLKCLEKDPQRRYATAADVAAELNRWLAGQSILARPVSRIERGIRCTRRNPLVAGLSAAVVLSLLVGTVVSTWFAFNVSVEAAATRAEAKRAYYNYYIMQMNFAHRDWKNNAIESLQERLLKTTPEFTGGHDLRGFEWYCLDSLPHRSLRTVNGPVPVSDSFSTEPTSILSKDQTKVVSGDFDNSAKVWDAATGRELVTLKGHTNVISGVDFDPTGKRVVTASYDDTLRVWDSSTGTVLVTLKGHSQGVNCVAFSPDGSRIVSGGSYSEQGIPDGTVRIWDATTGKGVHVLKGHTGSLRSVAFSPDGSKIASGGQDSIIRVWDTATGQQLLAFSGHASSVKKVVFSPDGKWVASCSLEIKIWDATTGVAKVTIGDQSFGFSVPILGDDPCLAFSPDLTMLAGKSSDDNLTVWDTVSGRELITYHGDNSGVSGLAFNREGTEILSISSRNSIHVWDVCNRPESISLKRVNDRNQSRPQPIWCKAIDPEANRVFGESDNSLLEWNMTTGHMTRSYSGLEYISEAAESADGRRVAGIGNSSQLIVWDTVNGEQIRSVKQDAEGAFTCLAISPNGEHIVSSWRGWTLQVWNVSTGEEVATMRGHIDFLACVAYSPDGKRIVSGGSDRIVRVWEAATGQEVIKLEGHQGRVSCVAFSPDNKQVISGGDDGVVKVWNVDTGRELLTLLGHTHGVECVAIRPSGDRIASGNFTEFKLWDATTGQEVVSSDEGTTCMAFSRDGTRLVTGKTIDKIAIWDATPRDGRKKLPLFAK